MKALLDWQGGKRGANTVALDVKRFLLYVSQRNLEVGSSGLASYRSHLEKSKALSDGSRQSYYSNARAFVETLAQRLVVPTENYPAGFRGVRKEPKETFVEKVAEWKSVREFPEFDEWIKETESPSGVDGVGREVLAVCEGWMSTLRSCAETCVVKQISDWEYARGIVADQRQGPYSSRWNAERSVENAIGYLHELYGYLVPPSPEWPKGISDYCKTRAWPPDRLKAALFPTAKSLDSFLVLGLANHRLAPNVDSILFYSFVGCISPKDEQGVVELNLGKFRGAPIKKDFSHRDPLITALHALEEIVTRGLAHDNVDTKRLEENGGVPLFLHYWKSGGRKEVRPFDPTMASYMVRRFISGAAKSHPVLTPMVGAITGENFRTTHLLCRRLRGESIFGLQHAANHKDPRTTAGYVNRVEVEASSRIRYADYQRYLVKESKGEQLRRLGNGFHCEPSSSEQHACLRIDSCGSGEDGCPARRIVLESPRIVAEWIAWRRHIDDQRNYLQTHRPERWESVWAKRLLEYEVLLEQVSSSMRKQAEKFVRSVQLMPLD